jgi:hypothetical protein
VLFVFYGAPFTKSFTKSSKHMRTKMGLGLCGLVGRL